MDRYEKDISSLGSKGGVCGGVTQHGERVRHAKGMATGLRPET